MLESGTRLSSYEIIAAIGAGGMGEVYRATDTKLGRDVALKILPASFTNDPERVARFRREAQVLAALNHPHIAQIYGLEEANGTEFLVLELVDGESLDKRIARGPIAVDEALGIAKQIAEALEAAHEKGIIHRDLKPANIALTTEGSVKVLDFGLAKAVESIHRSADLANSPTITSPAMMTGVGVILGTAAYMAPEQAKGRAADKRSDIWAFGCVIYEMLSGRPAFEQGTVTETLAAVLRGEPDWAALPSTTPPTIQTLVRRCLRKEPRGRVPHIGLARLECEDLLESPRHGVSETVAHRDWRLTLFVSVAAIVIAVVVWAGLRASPVAPAPPVTRFLVGLSSNARLYFGDQQQQPAVAVSPDGTRLVYAAIAGSAAPMLYVRSSDHLDAIPIRGTEGASHPFFSPDGHWVGFNSQDAKLKKVPLAGGTAVTICDASNLGGAAWLSDGTIVFAGTGAGRSGSLQRVSAGGGSPQELAKPGESEGALRWPEAMPGDKAILFAVQGYGPRQGATAIGVLRLDTGERKLLIDPGTMPHYLSSGHLVFVRSGVTMAVPFDARTLQIKGEPTAVVDEVAMSAGSPQLAVSYAGAAAYVRGSVSDEFGRTLATVDRHGNEEPIEAPAQAYDDVRVSPDGQRLALSINAAAVGNPAQRNIWVYDFSRKTLSRLTFEAGEAETPAWTPDGRRITYAVINGSVRELRWRSADGGPEDVLASSDHHLHLGSWSPGPNNLVVESSVGADAGTLWILRRVPKPSLAPFLHVGGQQLHSPVISPDGRWIAYEVNDGRLSQIYVQSFPGLDTKYQISDEGGREPRWAKNGKELFYRSGTKMMSVAVDNNSNDTFRAGRSAVLFETHVSSRGGSGRDGWYDATPDGGFVMIKVATAESSNAIVMVQNWAAELKARVPTK